VARGLLDVPTDIDVLDNSELADALGGAGPSRWAIAQRRDVVGRHRAQDGPPKVFTGDPSISALEVVEVDGDTFTGWAASGGRHEGTARVIRGAGEPLAPGEILVARTTDPSWTPLFLTAGAIVVAVGGPLSHAAIIARELGLPAVLNVPGIVKRIVEGVRLAVEGDAGTVTIMEPSSLTLLSEATDETTGSEVAA
jgi:phosphohistidine swiveling domain-containing protein